MSGPLGEIFQTDDDWSDLGDGVLVYTVNHRPYLVRDTLQQGNPYRDEGATVFRSEYATRHIDVKTGWRVTFDDQFISHNTRIVKAAGRVYPASLSYDQFRALEHPRSYEIKHRMGSSDVEPGYTCGLRSNGWSIALKEPWGIHPEAALATWMKGDSPGDPGLLAVVEIIGWHTVVSHIINRGWPELAPARVVLPVVDDDSQAMIARLRRENAALSARVGELEARQITCECDPTLPASQRCNGKWARCHAGVRSLEARRAKGAKR